MIKQHVWQQYLISLQINLYSQQIQSNLFNMNLEMLLIEVSVNHTQNFRPNFGLTLLLTGEEHGRMSQIIVVPV